MRDSLNPPNNKGLAPHQILIIHQTDTIIPHRLFFDERLMRI